MKLTALGNYLIVIPHDAPLTTWQVVMLSAAGNYCGAKVGFKSRVEAMRGRRQWAKHHAKLAAETATRSARRKKTPCLMT